MRHQPLQSSLILIAALMMGPATVGCDGLSDQEEEALRGCGNWVNGGPCLGDETCYTSDPCMSIMRECIDGTAVVGPSGVCAECEDVEMLTLEEVEQLLQRCRVDQVCTHPDPEGDRDRTLVCTSSGFQLIE